MPQRGGTGRVPPVKAIWVLVASLAFQGFSGLGGGVALILDPTGSSIGIPLGWLAGSPFSDYAVPGLVLASLLGMGPLVVAHGVWTRRSWSWAASVGVGLGLMTWLAVEIAVIGYQSEPPLQLMYGLVAALILGAAARPATRRYLGRTHSAVDD